MSLESSHHGDIFRHGEGWGVSTQLYLRTAMMVVKAGSFPKVFVLKHSFPFPAYPQNPLPSAICFFLFLNHLEKWS